MLEEKDTISKGEFNERVRRLIFFYKQDGFSYRDAKLLAEDEVLADFQVD